MIGRRTRIGARTSAFGGKAYINHGLAERPLIAKSGHRDADGGSSPLHQERTTTTTQPNALEAPRDLDHGGAMLFLYMIILISRIPKKDSKGKYSF